MTPQEKAIELVEKFTPISGHVVFSKHYALIAVDEIIKANPVTVIDNNIISVDWWKEVKQEIEKL